MLEKANEPKAPAPTPSVDTGLIALVTILGFYEIPADAQALIVQDGVRDHRRAALDVHLPRDAGAELAVVNDPVKDVLRERALHL